MIKVLEVNLLESRMNINKSPWIYSNQIHHISDENLKESKINLVKIVGTKKIGLYCKQHLISIRFLPDRFYSLIKDNCIDEEIFINEIAQHLICLKKSKEKLNFPKNEAYRLSHGDSDGLPAIAIDDYQSVIVLQSSSNVGEFLLDFIVKALIKIDARPIFERSSGQIRKLENLPERTRWIKEPLNSSNNFEVTCDFVKLKMSFFLNKSQKTGLFLDQRKNIEYLSSILNNFNINSCLDVCSYAGAWSSAAASVGVKNLTLIDQDSWALNLAKRNILANANGSVNIEALHGDMFEHMQGLIKKEFKYDLIIVDPPAFAKSKKNVKEARRAYSRMAKLASKLTEKNGILVICSCSRHVQDFEFLESVFTGLEGNQWIFMHKGEQSPCHTHIANPDSSEYLKCYFLFNRNLDSY